MYLIGQAKDIHLLKKTRKPQKIKLGGFCLDSYYKIIAHSDGDLILHAVANAILGSIQKMDIGHYFSDQDQKNKNLDSSKILFFCLELLQKENKEIVNIDMTITCENIYLHNEIKNITNNLVRLIGNNRINVKATRFEKRNNTICCEAIVLIKEK